MAQRKSPEAIQFAFDVATEEAPQPAGRDATTEPADADRSLADQLPADQLPADRRAAGRGSDREARARAIEAARQALAAGKLPEAATAVHLEQTSSPVTPVAGAAPDSALSVAAFYDRLRSALRQEFPDDIWITGEIRKVTVSKGHRYIELADHTGASGAPPRPAFLTRNRGGYGGASANAGAQAGPAATLEVSCWSREWPTIAATLEPFGIELTAGLVVRVRGRVSVWEAGARVRFSMTDIDVEALVGGIAAARRRLLSMLEAEGVLEANRRRPLTPVPLRVGIVTSANSEAHRDFSGQLERSGFAFRTLLESSLVQGVEAPMSIARAIERLAQRPVDLIVLVRGGGARGDLAAFDHELVARAIVGCRLPVWTGVGHTGDRSVADEVANRHFPTPTACGEAVVNAVATFMDVLANKAARVRVLGDRAMRESVHAIRSARSDLIRAARHELGQAEAASAQARGRLAHGAAVAIGRCEGGLARRADALGAKARHQFLVAGHDIERRRAEIAAFDPRTQLQRGWSLTRRSDGSILRSVSQVAAGERLTTIVADGKVESVAESSTPDSKE